MMHDKVKNIYWVLILAIIDLLPYDQGETIGLGQVESLE